MKCSIYTTNNNDSASTHTLGTDVAHLVKNHTTTTLC